jgi:putative sigma-54 modulation protein
MKFIISGKNIEVTEALKERAGKKLGKLEKFFPAHAEAHITMSVERIRHILEVTIHFNGIVMRAEVEGEDMYSCIDKAMDIIEGQIRKNKTKLEKKLRANALAADNFSVENLPEEEGDFRIVRTKRFAIKPMTTQEAILQMNLLGHEFFMFSNDDTKQINVVYKRKDGNYGLIEPDFV